jgi:branched-chain amino acid transport system ATP-binding protein
MLFDVNGLSKRFGAIKALSEVSFHVRAGEVLGLIGPNGA